MKLESVGILTGLRPFGDRDAVAVFFTRDFGVLHGMLRGAAAARKNRPLVGQVGNVSWTARLDSQLGVFHFEPSRNLSAQLMSDAPALAQMNSVFSLIATLLPEREKYEALYDATIGMLGGVCVGDSYLSWEIILLRELGYALDLTRCSGCGATENLNYLSPKTGRAVCDKCAAPYIGRLFELPLTLAVTRKFLENICGQMNVKLPIARSML